MHGYSFKKKGIGTNKVWWWNSYDMEMRICMWVLSEVDFLVLLSIVLLKVLHYELLRSNSSTGQRNSACLTVVTIITIVVVRTKNVSSDVIMVVVVVAVETAGATRNELMCYSSRIYSRSFARDCEGARDVVVTLRKRFHLGGSVMLR